MAFVYLGAFLNFWDSFFARGALLEFCAFALTFRLLFAFGRSDFFTVLRFWTFALLHVALSHFWAVVQLGLVWAFALLGLL